MAVVENMTINYNTNGVANSNALVTTNENVNTANINAVENGNENVNTAISDIDTSNWLTYENEEYGFSIRYPNNFSYWQANISDKVQRQDGDGNIFSVGFRPTDLWGSILIVDVFENSLLDATLALPQINGQLTNEVVDLGDIEAIRITGVERQLGIESYPPYSYILKVNNLRNDSDIAIFDSMANTFKSKQ